MRQLRRLYDLWMAFAEAWGQVMITLLFGVCYLVLFAPFRLAVTKLQPASKPSFWLDREQTEVSLESLRRMA